MGLLVKCVDEGFSLLLPLLHSQCSKLTASDHLFKYVLTLEARNCLSTRKLICILGLVTFVDILISSHMLVNCVAIFVWMRRSTSMLNLD